MNVFFAEEGISTYTHMSDQHSTYGTKVIVPSAREAHRGLTSGGVSRAVPAPGSAPGSARSSPISCGIRRPPACWLPGRR
jgi:hypothetical protein